jgi:hypothetical protein
MSSRWTSICLVALATAGVSLASAQDPASRGWRSADVRDSARARAKRESLSGATYHHSTTKSTGLSRTLRRRARPETDESASFGSLRSWRRGAAIYDGAFDSAYGSSRIRAGAAEATLDLGHGRFAWTDEEGKRRHLRGAAARAGARAVAVGLEAESPGLVIPSGLGRFEAKVTAQANVSAEARAVGVAGWTPEEGAKLRGLASVGAFAESSLALPMEADVKGVRLRVVTKISGYAGAGLRGVFHVEFDPRTARLRLSGDLGAALGLGAAGGVSVEVDASTLMSRVGRWLAPPPATATPRAPPRRRESPSAPASSPRRSSEDALSAPPRRDAGGLTGALGKGF